MVIATALHSNEVLSSHQMMEIENRPRLIDFPKIGRPDIGYLSIGEEVNSIPFEIKRVFWAYFTPESVVRGRHAHYHTEMVLIATAGRIVLTTEMGGGEIETFVLDRPTQGVYMPPLCWHTMQYSHNAVQLVLANTRYDEADYIRSYEEFKRLTSKKT